MAWTFTDHNGKLALTLGWHASMHKPEREQHLVIANIPATSWADLIGQECEFTNGNWGRTWRPHIENWIMVDTTGWEHSTITEPVAPPRDGRQYTWKWSYGRWIKDAFPLCDECREVHDPKYQPCEHCGKCKPVKHDCRPYCYECRDYMPRKHKCAQPAA